MQKSSKHKELNNRQQAFVREYCNPSNGFSATHAYARAYGLDLTTQYDSAKRSASRLISTNVHVMGAIEVEKRRILERHDNMVDMIMQQWLIIGTVDITELLDIQSQTVRLKELSELPPYLLACIKSVKNTAYGIDVTFHDKHRALEKMAKALGLFTTVVQNANEPYEDLVSRIDRLRREQHKTIQT